MRVAFRCVQSIAALSCVVLAAAASARGGVSVDVGNGAKIKGSLNAAGEADAFRIPCPKGATLRVKAKGKKGLSFAIDVATPVGDKQQQFAAKGSVRRDEGPLEATGTYVVSVRAGDGTSGDYALSLAFKLPKRTLVPVTLGEGDVSVPFSAEAGTAIKIAVTADKGSPALPRIVRVSGPDGFVLVGSGAAKAAGDKLGKSVLPTTGDYQVVISGDGPGGAATVRLDRKAPRTAKLRLDLRGKAIGSSAGERLAVSDVVGSEGGAVAVPLPSDGGPDSVIAGSSVVVPAGALTSPTPLVVATAPDVKPKGRDGGAGPSVFFGPEGLRFGQPVNVTIPFDVAQFGGDVSSLRVYTRDARGKVSLVPGPYDVDLDAGTCSFAASHFSSFRAAREGAGGKGAGEFAGVWRLVTNTTPGEEAFLVIGDDGRVDVVGTSISTTFCTRVQILPPGTPLGQFVRIVGGRLQIITLDEPSPDEYVRAELGDLPADCTTVEPPLQGVAIPQRR